jgi:hypothetical protein
LTKSLILSTLSNAQQRLAESDIVLIKGTRPYSIYKKDESVKIFTPKADLTVEENAQIARWNNEISQLQSNTSEESSKPVPNEERITAFKNSILSLENQIFTYTHTESSSNIRAKGIIRNEDSYSTIFVLSQQVKNGSILVIQPSDNRIVAYDNNHMGIQNKKKVINTWAFANDSVISNDNIRASRENIFNYGTYGSGAISNNSKILYNAEIVNYVKDFIDYIDRNRSLNDQFKEDHILYNNGREIKGTISRIHTFGFDNKEYLIKKYDSFIKLKPKNTETYKFEDVLRVFDTIMTYDIYNSFFNQNALKSLIEGTLDTNLSGLSITNTDTIEFVSNNKTEIIYDYNGENSFSTYPASLLSFKIDIDIPNKIKEKQSQIENLQLQIAQSSSPSQIASLKQQIENTKQDIAKLKLDYNRFSYYLENIKKSNPGGSILGNVCLDIQESGDSATIKDDPNININNYYILNIDAEQGCSLDYDKLPKILINIKYECLNVLGAGLEFVDSFRFCPKVGLGQIKIGGYNVDIQPTTTTYTISQEELDKLTGTNSHPELSWGTGRPRSSERTFFLNGKDTRGGIVKATYTYLIPEYSPNRVTNPQGELDNKVKDIFNLNESNKIYVDFKRINRNLRNVDSLYYKHVPTIDGLLVKSLSPPPGGPIDNTLKVWECYGIKDGSSLPLPLNFKWMNLVKYMTFYNKFLFTNQNKIFDINGGLDLVKTRDEMGLIPYDYK